MVMMPDGAAMERPLADGGDSAAASGRWNGPDAGDEQNSFQYSLQGLSLQAGEKGK
jgi:hypothetical protein